MVPALKMGQKSPCKIIKEVKQSSSVQWALDKSLVRIYSKCLTNTMNARNKQYCLCIISKICLIIHLHLCYIGCIEISNTYPCQDHLNLNEI